MSRIFHHYTTINIEEENYRLKKEIGCKNDKYLPIVSSEFIKY